MIEVSGVVGGGGEGWVMMRGDPFDLLNRRL